jgi:hypothetical protein
VALPEEDQIRNRDIMNNATLADNSQRILERTLESRPLNTKRAYTSKQAEFITWCLDKKQFSDRDTVRE